MTKTILLIHGRDYKPPQASLKKLWLEALRVGIERDHSGKLSDFDAATKEFVYYGDVSNNFLSERRNEPVPDDTAGRRKTLNDLKKYKKPQFTKANYNKLPGKNSWKEAIADAVAGPLSFFGISDPIITAVAPDMREYWNPDSEFGTLVRFPMIAPLKRAMNRGGEILVISHSLGTMIAYDTFWKFCRYGEYRPDYHQKKVHFWITLGSPLADETVKRNLKGARAEGKWRYPDNIVDWLNVAAEDDYISHDGEVSNDFQEMKELKLIRSLTDKRIYNLSVRDGKSNPHHEAGYLLHPVVSAAIAKWL